MSDFTTIKVSKRTVELIKKLSEKRGLKHTAAQTVDMAIGKAAFDEKILHNVYEGMIKPAICSNGEIIVGDTLEFIDKNTGEKIKSIVNEITDEMVIYDSWNSYSNKSDGYLWHAKIVSDRIEKK